MATGFKQLNAAARYLIPSFKGRLTYDEYSYATLWFTGLFLVVYLFFIFTCFIVVNSTMAQGAGLGIESIITIAVTCAFFIFTCISKISLFVRRLHDAGKSGHWMWLFLLGIGIIPMLFSLGDSDGKNAYGNSAGGGQKPGFSDLKNAVTYYFQPICDRLTYKEFMLSSMVLGYVYSFITGIVVMIFFGGQIVSLLFQMIRFQMMNASAAAESDALFSALPGLDINYTSIYILIGILCVLTIVFCVIHIRLTVRRLHDTGRSGRVYWWSLIPVIGICVPLMMIFCDSDGDNSYGKAKTLN